MNSHEILSVLAAMLAGASFGANSFRVTPYVQHPKPDAMTVMWLAQEAGDASITYWKVGSSDKTTLSATERNDLSSDDSGIRFKADGVLEYCLAPELGYDMDPNGGNDKERGGGWDLPATVPWQYRVRLTGLEADTEYGYRVQLTNGASYENTFRTAPDPDPTKWRGFKFIYYSDSETEPGDNDPGGLTTDWDVPAGSPRATKTYYASQTRAYASNICAAVDFGTELIVMAGDLAQRGSRQCDWDEFWRHNAGPLNDPAGSIPILASPGNHDYWSYNDNSVIGPKKYLSYFEYEQNDADGMGDDQRERFYRVDYGPVTFIFLDGNNGDDSDKSRDTNHSISTAGGCRAPDFNEGSPQYRWLETQLADAQKKSAFTFIVTHQCPFSVGHHGQDTGHDTLSGRPLRVWLPILHKYGVDGWFAGHDEMMERSISEGTEILPDGTEVPHSLNVWDMGIAGDGLRGVCLADNPYQRYRASVDSPEVFENGVHVEGGVHYGHLQVTVDQTEDGRWRATFDPIYLFFSKDSSGNLVYGGVRHYADKVVRISNRRKGEPPAPQPVTKTSVDYSTYAPAKMPQGLVTTFWNGPLSRGFSWQTDTSVTETKLWLLKGEYDQDDGNTFVNEGTCFTGDYTDNASVLLRCHRLHVTGLENDSTYSYRLGGNGHYVYGRFRTQRAPDSVTAVYFSDTQTKDAKLLYKIENTLAAAARVVGGSDKANLLISGGDIFNQSTMANVNHVTGRAYAGSWEWAWGLTADLITPYFPDLPWFTVPGNHDKAYYGKLTSVDYYSTDMAYAGCSSVDVGNVHFALLPFLDSYAGKSAEYAKAFAWLDADLKASSALWKVVCVHWGPYSTGDHGGVKNGYGEGVVEYVKALAPLLSSNHVDLVLQAHDHVFTKTVPYRWDTAGYTSATNDETVLNLNPETAMIGGVAYDVNPRGTYYVCTGCAGHRAAEEPTCPTIDGEHSFTKRDPCIVVGKIGVQSRFRNIGDYASADFHEIDAKGFQMYGVLKVDGDRLAYDFYVAEEDGTSTLVDKLRVCKDTAPSPDGRPGTIVSADCVGHVTKEAVDGGFVFRAAAGYTIASVYANGAPVEGLGLGSSVTVTGQTLMDMGEVALVVSADRISSAPKHPWYESPRAVATNAIAGVRGAFHGSIDGEYFGFALGGGGTGGARLYDADSLDAPLAFMPVTGMSGNNLRSVAVSKKRNLVVFGNYKEGDVYAAPLNATSWTLDENVIRQRIVTAAGATVKAGLDTAVFSDDGRFLFGHDGKSGGSTLFKYEVGDGVLTQVGSYAVGSVRTRDLAYARLNGREILFVLTDGDGKISAHDVTDFGNVVALGAVVTGLDTTAVYGGMCISGRAAGNLHLTVATSSNTAGQNDLVNVYGLNVPASGAVTATPIKSFSVSDLTAAGFPVAGVHSKAILVADDERTMYFAYGAGTATSDPSVLVSCESLAADPVDAVNGFHLLLR